MTVDQPLNSDVVRAWLGARVAASPPRALADAFRCSLAPLDTNATLEQSITDWARAVRASGVGPGHMIAGLRELWLTYAGSAPALVADRPVPLRLSDVIGCAVTAYLQDDQDDRSHRDD